MKSSAKLTREQKSILKKSGVELHFLNEKRLLEIVSHNEYVKDITEDELVEVLRVTNALYRGGHPLISDADYDGVFLEALQQRNPTHPYLYNVEPEAAFEGPKVDLPVQMYSTEKGMSLKAIENWVKRIKKAANEIGVDTQGLEVRITPKLDGFAAYDDGKILYTRGDGRKGTDISRVFNRGLAVVGGARGAGAGEIVVDREYFEKNLSEYFENTRNFQSTIIKEKKLEPHVEEAIKENAVVFYPFVQLPSRVVAIEELLVKFDDVVGMSWESLKYDVDGAVLEVTDDKLKKYMGSTAQFHKWQIAYKTKPEKAQVEVLSVIPQTSRMGRITPVVELVPTKLSGATISRATAHHFGMVKSKGIGRGAIIELVRSGLVIPKIENVVQKATPDIPVECPSCHEALVWDSDNLLCPNVGGCPAQIANTIEHFFNTLRNINGFGSATIEKLFSNGIKDVCEIYKLTESDFIGYGFGEKQSQNLVSELMRSRSELLEDWRFLAAFGVHRLGLANCQQLLKHIKLLEIFNLTEEMIVSRKVFAAKTAQVIVKGLKKIKKEFDCLYGLTFNIETTKLMSELQADGVLSPIAGKQIVFTGTMVHGSREQMERDARLLGAKVGSAVSGRTDFLVTGLDIGQSKIENARKKNVAVITEAEYWRMIHGHG